MAVLDDPGGNPAAQLAARVHERRKTPYAWTCPNPTCGAANMGYVEDGCPACGAGKDAVQGEPERAIDYQCRACRGQGTVDRKCGECQGTGAVTLPEAGQPPEDCKTCGGAGVVARDCARCGGTGIDPEPQVAAVKVPAMPAVDPPKAGAIPAMPPGASPAAGIFEQLPVDLPRAQALRDHGKLPSLDDPPLTSAPTVVRYRLLRYEGPADALDRTFRSSLRGTWVEDNGNTLTAMEIAPPAEGGAVDEQMKALRRAGDGAWPVRQRDPFKEG